MIDIKPITHEIQLSFGSSDVKRTVIKQNSKDTHILAITLYDNNDAITMDPDNTFLVEGSENKIIVSDNIIKIHVSRQLLAAPGSVSCELAIYQPDGACYFSDTFFIYVEPNVNSGSELESTSEYHSLVETLIQVKEYEQEVLKSKENVDKIEDAIQGTCDELREAVEITSGLIEENRIIQQNESDRIQKESERQQQEERRQADTASALARADLAAKRADEAAIKCESLLDGMMEHFSDTEPEDQPEGFFWLQEY